MNNGEVSLNDVFDAWRTNGMVEAAGANAAQEDAPKMTVAIDAEEIENFMVM
jgi:hypothetical protein